MDDSSEARKTSMRGTVWEMEFNRGCGMGYLRVCEWVI